MTTSTATRKGAPIGGIIWLAVVAIIVKFVIPALPVFNGHSINQAYGVCNSGLGALAQSFDHAVANDCNIVNNVMLVANVTAGTALVLAVVFGIRWARRSFA